MDNARFGQAVHAALPYLEKNMRNLVRVPNAHLHMFFQRHMPHPVYWVLLTGYEKHRIIESWKWIYNLVSDADSVTFEPVAQNGLRPDFLFKKDNTFYVVEIKCGRSPSTLSKACRQVKALMRDLKRRYPMASVMGAYVLLPAQVKRSFDPEWVVVEEE